SAVTNSALVGAWEGNGNGAGTLYEAVVSSEQAFPNAHAGNVIVSTRPEGAPEASFPGLDANTTYYLFARAISHAGAPTAYTALGATVTLVNPPTTAVTTFTAVTSASLTAAWSANGNGAGTQYSAALSTSVPYPNGSAGNIVVSTSPVGAPWAIFSPLYSNATYYLSVSAINRAGSPTAYVPLGSTVTVPSVPATVASTFTSVDAGSMTVAWGANNNIADTRYEATVSTESAFPNFNTGNVTVSTEPLGAPSAEINNLVGNTTYYLAVRTIGRDGVPSAYLTLGSTVTLAFAPATVVTTFTAVNASSLTFNWSANGNAVLVTTYTVQISTDINNFNALYSASFTTAPAGASPQYTFTGLNANTTYFLRVNAINHNGIASAYTALGSASTLAMPPATIVSTFSALGTDGFTVAWSTNGNAVTATAYTVRVSTDLNNFSAAYSQSDSTAPVGANPQYTFTGLYANATYFLQ
ncbi:MAG: fibronectin type III domain-containing protein, partial [Nitrospirota bacterium]